ncbi:hypothetical protein [Mesorhizobium sp. M1C.F.Ca.ET.187.01.1.1]|uniref:hypothetical protein n=1 Tax=unclassified Mesorhizobium TaxID=325217 RepID=UPI0032AFF4AD
MPPPDNIIFNNIHNATVINNTVINNETVNQAGQPSGNAEGGLTTRQKMTGAAVGTGAALAARVALPPVLRKRAATSGRAQYNQEQSGLPVKPGQRAIQGQQPGVANPQSEVPSTTRRLSTEHALPGAGGKALPLVNGKPVLGGRNLPGNKSRKQFGRQGIVGGNQEATGNAGAAATGEQGTGQQKGKKLRKLPTVNGMPADNGQGAQQRFGKNNPNVPSGKPKKLTRRDLSAGQAIVEPGDQGSANRDNKSRKFRKLPTVNGEPADNRPSVQKRLRRNNPDVFSDQTQGPASGNDRGRKFRRLPTVNGEPADNGPSMQKRLRRNNPSVFSDENQGSVGGNDRSRKFRRLQNEEGSAGPEVNVQRNFKVNRPNENAQRQFRQERPNEQVLRPQRSEPKPEFRAQPRPQMQERRLPQQQPPPQQQFKKKPSCGQQGEPACQQ